MAKKEVRSQGSHKSVSEVKEVDEAAGSQEVDEKIDAIQGKPREIRGKYKKFYFYFIFILFLFLFLFYFIFYFIFIFIFILFFILFLFLFYFYFYNNNNNNNTLQTTTIRRIIVL
jgi:Flp pilus assembly protein TadB